MLTDISEQDAERLKEIINQMLTVNFLVKELEREKYLLARRYREQLTRFFQFLNWEIVFDDRHECIFTASRDVRHRRTLSRDESVWLLIICLIYQEKRRELSLSEFPVSTLYEIRSKYETFRLPFVNKTKLQELVRLCTRYKMMEALDPDIFSDDCRFRLFHTLMYAVDADRVEKLHEKIRRYETGAEGGQPYEVDEETAPD
ncbi:MAG: DUF4194 domain-containing protein [Peptococcaceae bacterium]|nr:DUF4194 domain-containing protein [Peptococcaceae bacterium]